MKCPILPRFLCACLLAVFTGCSSAPKVDWDGRIGRFTYDQAVLELGPPDSVASLDDGSKVADWFQSAAPQFSFGVGTGYSSGGYYRGGTGVGVGQTVTTAPSGRYLRLVFGPDGNLARWENVRR